MAKEKDNSKLSDTFREENNMIKRTPEEWRKLEREMTEYQARHRNSTYNSVPKVPGK